MLYLIQARQPMDKLTHEELTYLQDSATALRAILFNRSQVAKHRKQEELAVSQFTEYKLVCSIRNKLYAVNNRDTLALDPKS